MNRLLEVVREIDPNNGWIDVKEHDYSTECYITALGFEGNQCFGTDRRMVCGR